ncbi:MAG: replicative DNA helicase, partial [Planctomycetota bacterium JB042]
LIELADAALAMPNLETCVRLVQRANARNALIDAGKVLQVRAATSDATIEEMIGDAKTALDDATNALPDAPPFAEQVAEFAEDLERQRRGEEGATLAAKTGFIDLDEMLNVGGLPRRSLVVCAGRPSMGKSTVAMNAVLHAARNGARCLVWPMEEGLRGWLDRACRHLTGVKTKSPRDMSDADFETLQRTLVVDVPALKLEVLDNDRPASLAEIRRQARRFASRHDGIDVLVVDHLTLLKLPKAERRDLAVAEMTRGLKLLAAELDCCVLLVCQLNRQVEAREGHEPRLSDLRDSGAIEQDADVALFVHRPSYYIADKRALSEEQLRLAKLIVAKQRNGETGVVPLLFFGETFTFKTAVFGMGK